MSRPLKTLATVAGAPRTPEEFAGFDRPGSPRSPSAFSVDACGDGASVLTMETRVA